MLDDGQHVLALLAERYRLEEVTRQDRLGLAAQAVTAAALTAAVVLPASLAQAATAQFTPGQA